MFEELKLITTMKTRNKIITCLAVAVIAIGTAIGITGCHKEEQGDKYLSYAETAGKTVAYVINLSDKFTEKDVKAKVLEFLGKVLPVIPKEITPASVKDELVAIKVKVMAEIEISETLRPMVDAAVDILIDFAKTGLDKIAEKYPTECENTDTYYKIVYKFVDTVDSTLGRLDIPTNEVRGAENAYAYDVANAQVGGLKKEEYEELVNALLKK